MIKRIVLENDFSKVKIDSKDDISRYFKDFNYLDLKIRLLDKENNLIFANLSDELYTDDQNESYFFDISDNLKEIVTFYYDSSLKELLFSKYFDNSKEDFKYDDINYIPINLCLSGDFIFVDDSFFKFEVDLDDAVGTNILAEMVKVFGSEDGNSIADKIMGLYDSDELLLKDFKDELKKVLLNLN
jgi:hypothetical protein